MSNVLFADAPVSAPVADVRVAPAAPAPIRRRLAARRPSAYLRAIDPSFGAPTGPSAYLRAIDPSLGAPASGASAYLNAIAGGSAR